MNPPISIILVEDEELSRKGLLGLLENQNLVRIVAVAQNAKEALLRIKEYRPQVVLLDISMPGISGLDILPTIIKEFPRIKVLMISQHDENSFIHEAIIQGALGYLLKSEVNQTMILEAVASVIENNFYFTRIVSNMLLKEVLSQKLLKPRFNNNISLNNIEKEILKLICQEKLNKEIADELFKSPRTIETYRRKLMKKTGAKNVVGLAIYAMQQNLCS